MASASPHENVPELAGAHQACQYASSCCFFCGRVMAQWTQIVLLGSAIAKPQYGLLHALPSARSAGSFGERDM